MNSAQVICKIEAGVKVYERQLSYLGNPSKKTSQKKIGASSKEMPLYN